MSANQIISDIIKAASFKALSKEHSESSLKSVLKQYLPKNSLADKNSLQLLLKDTEMFTKLQKILQFHNEISERADQTEQQSSAKKQESNGKKITRAALARRHQKTQQEIKKDQIFVRLIPKSQSCIQFMLCNRNFPRMQCKLSCNQHLQYLVNYLTNKWIRGKVGYRILLYPDTSFLKGMNPGDRQKVIKQPLNNYLMFTDVMTGCGVHQNGVLNLNYQIAQAKKGGKQATPEIKIDYISQHPIKQEFRHPSLPQLSHQSNFPQEKGQKIVSPGRRDDPKEVSMFNKNSNYFNQQSFFGSLGFNFNFGVTPHKKEEHIISVNSLNYMDMHFQQHLKQEDKQKSIPFEYRPQKDSPKKQISSLKEEQEASVRSESAIDLKDDRIQQSKQKYLDRSSGQEKLNDPKLGALVSFLDEIEPKEHSCLGNQENNSNKPRDVKTVCIVKKRTNG